MNNRIVWHTSTSRIEWHETSKYLTHDNMIMHITEAQWRKVLVAEQKLGRTLTKDEVTVAII